MVKKVNNMKNKDRIDNININNDRVIDTYIDGDIKGIVTVKTYSYCYKCLKDMPPSTDPFCCWECQQDYYAEQRKELDACYREWMRGD